MRTHLGHHTLALRVSKNWRRRKSLPNPPARLHSLSRPNLALRVKATLETNSEYFKAAVWDFRCLRHWHGKGWKVEVKSNVKREMAIWRSARRDIAVLIGVVNWVKGV